MATKIELLQEAEKRGILPQNKKAVFDEAVSRGLIQGPSTPLATGGDVPFEKTAGLSTQNTLTPEQLQSLVSPDPFEELAQEQGPIRTGAISTGRGLFKIARALGIAEPESETEKKAFEALGKESPIITAVGESVGEALPFLPLGVGAGQFASIPGRVAATAGLGAVEGSLISKGEGGSESEQIFSGGVGGIAAGSLELVLPVIGRLGGKLIRKVLKTSPKSSILTPDGLPTDELLSALKTQDIEFGDLKDAAMELIANAPEGSDAGQALRSSLLEIQGLKGGSAPTKAQITRDPTSFQQQQELRKTSGAVRARLESQQGVLANNFDDAIAGTSGRPVTSGSPVTDHVVNKATALDNEIFNLYQEAKVLTNNEEVVPLGRFFANLKRRKKDNDLTGGLIKSLEGVAESRGILDSKTGVFRDVSVEEAENLVKSINARFSKTNDNSNRISRQLKNAIDDDVAESGGQGLFKSARQAKAKFEADLSRSKISKFDKRKTSLVRDVLENKIDPDNFTEKVLTGKTYRKDDIESLKKYFTTGTPDQIEQGAKAWNDFRAETIDLIKNKSFVGPEDAQGNRNLSRAALENITNKIGFENLEVVLEPQEIKFLKEMIDVSRILEPPGGTALGLGPSGQVAGSVIDSLKRRIDKVPILNVFLDMSLDGSGKVLKAKPVIRDRSLSKITRAKKVAGSTLPLAGSASFISRPDENEAE
jgi:hypothetical protein